MKVLVVSVHPDDETIGCGGTILNHVQRGDEVHWLIITSAAAGYSQEFIARREVQIHSITEAYGFAGVHRLGFPAARLHLVPFDELLGKVGDVVRRIAPFLVYTVNRSDIHSDHQIAFRAVMSCTKVFRYPSVKRILMYECLSETEASPPLPESVFSPNAWSDVTLSFEKKIEIMQFYEGEIQMAPLPRSLEAMRALAVFRGAAIGVSYAEAFMVLREVF